MASALVCLRVLLLARLCNIFVITALYLMSRSSKYCHIRCSRLAIVEYCLYTAAPKIRPSKHHFVFGSDFNTLDSTMAKSYQKALYPG